MYDASMSSTAVMAHLVGTSLLARSLPSIPRLRALCILYTSTPASKSLATASEALASSHTTFSSTDSSLGDPVTLRLSAGAAGPRGFVTPSNCSLGVGGLASLASSSTGLLERAAGAASDS